MLPLTVSHVTVPDLKAELKKHGITQDRVAKAAGVSRTMVAHLLAGRTKSANVVETAQKLIRRRLQRRARKAVKLDGAGAKA
jgi:transcriptional regulator with XRE-family HTH domain